MAGFDCKGVVIKVRDYGENDKIVTIFTDKLGKINVIARGAKRSKSKFLSVTLPFCFGQYMVYRGKGMYNLNEGSIINSFQEFLNDLDSLTYASYICELIDISMIEEESNRELFKILVTTLYLLKSKALDNELLLRAYEVNVLRNTGYGLNLNYCSLCRKKINSSNYISLQYYGGICDDCNKSGGFGISRVTYNLLKFLNSTPMDKIYRLNISEEAKLELKKTLLLLISNSYSRVPKSLQMFDFIKECEKNE
ncbi:DNA repair protein RecO [Clostridium sp. 19966]|uniref:DNA repair protein RecO n=1 Tax=Clostridium sp. 19966 TaxID=2768166 RepID=UPI0028DE1454|nr:DNA repair protein RecO [Clostridium sp. 19966]MDT8715323.1 DNA repair protein RecO [Clostridium sp. 19966]